VDERLKQTPQNTLITNRGLRGLAMKKLERLRKEALESCKFRGHKMRPFDRTSRHWWYSECHICGKHVLVNDNPTPNGIEISGEAVALSCKN